MAMVKKPKSLCPTHTKKIYKNIHAFNYTETQIHLPTNSTAFCHKTLFFFPNLPFYQSPPTSKTTRQQLACPGIPYPQKDHLLKYPNAPLNNLHKIKIEKINKIIFYGIAEFSYLKKETEVSYFHILKELKGLQYKSLNSDAPSRFYEVPHVKLQNPHGRRSIGGWTLNNLKEYL